MGIGDWGLGIGDWANPQSPIPNPQSPTLIKFYYFFKISNGNYSINIYLLEKLNSH